MIFEVTNEIIDKKTIQLFRNIFKFKDEFYEDIKDYNPILKIEKKEGWDYSINMDIVWDQFAEYDTPSETVRSLANFNPQGKSMSLQLSLDITEDYYLYLVMKWK